VEAEQRVDELEEDLATREECDQKVQTYVQSLVKQNQDLKLKAGL